MDEDMFDDLDNFYYEKESNKTTIGASLSIGFEYMISKNFGIHINANGRAGTIKSEIYTDYRYNGDDDDDDDYDYGEYYEMLPMKRSVFTIGVNAGINFRF